MEATKAPPRAKINDDYTCAVAGCDSSPYTHLHLKFHPFPRKGLRFVYVKNSSNQLERIDQREAWLRAMNAADVPSSAKLCSLHFEEEDYLVTGQSKRLKGIAVPSSNLQTFRGEESEGKFEFINIKMEETDGIEENNEETNDTKDNVLTSEMEIDTDCNNATSNNSWSEEYDIKPDLQSIKIEMDSVVTNNSASFKDAEVQVDTTDVLTCFSNIKKNSDISVVTGIKTFDLLNEIVHKLESAHDSKYEIPGRRFKTFDRVLLTFAKLKHDLPYDILSILFQCSKEDCERIFLETEERLKNCNLMPKHIKVSSDE